MATRAERRRIAANKARFDREAAAGGSSMTVCVRVRPLSNAHESSARRKQTGALKEVVRVSKVMPAVQVQVRQNASKCVKMRQNASNVYLHFFFLFVLSVSLSLSLSLCVSLPPFLSLFLSARSPLKEMWWQQYTEDEKGRRRRRRRRSTRGALSLSLSLSFSFD